MYKPVLGGMLVYKPVLGGITRYIPTLGGITRYIPTLGGIPGYIHPGRHTGLYTPWEVPLPTTLGIPASQPVYPAVIIPAGRLHSAEG